MARFLLLLHRPASTVAGTSPDDLRERVARYRAWREELTREGRILGGEKLTEDRGLWLRLDGGEVRTDGAGGAGGDRQDVISGYFLLQAGDYQEAAEIAGRCPHVQYGGTIELRQIEAT